MNVVARFRPISKRVLGRTGTRAPGPTRTRPAKRHLPVLGANDGASGVAVLLEVARLLKKSGPMVGVDIVFFDGEDLGSETDPNGYFRGSNRYVERIAGQKPPLFVIVLDMVGKKNLALHWEGNSRSLASNIVDLGGRGERACPELPPDVRHTGRRPPVLERRHSGDRRDDFAYPNGTTHDAREMLRGEPVGRPGPLSLVRKPNFPLTEISA
jgi:hypothetical protein